MGVVVELVLPKKCVSDETVEEDGDDDSDGRTDGQGHKVTV